MDNAACTSRRFAHARHRAPAGAFEKRWAWHCVRGNRASDRGEHEAAQQHYRHAVEIAGVALQMARSAGEAVPEEKIERWLSLWVISHLNLSDLHARADRPEHALQTVFAAYESMVECLHDPRVAARVHGACLRHVRHVLDGMKKLMTALGIPQAAAARIFARAQSLALGYWNVWA
jgi:hypothetical protein